MSFSNEVKNELSRLEVSKKCCERAELLGLLRVSGAVILQGRNMGIHFLPKMLLLHAACCKC